MMGLLQTNIKIYIFSILMHNPRIIQEQLSRFSTLGMRNSYRHRKGKVETKSAGIFTLLKGNLTSNMLQDKFQM